VTEKKIVVRCPDCGESRVQVGEVTLRECVDTGGWTYRARCPQCGVLFVDVTQRDAALRVLVAGAPVESWLLPAELDERPDGPPLTLTDLLELHLLLLEPDWFEQLAAA
jgi:uncharacterized Zn finger protein